MVCFLYSEVLVVGSKSLLDQDKTDRISKAFNYIKMFTPRLVTTDMYRPYRPIKVNIVVHVGGPDEITLTDRFNGKI